MPSTLLRAAAAVISLALPLTASHTQTRPDSTATPLYEVRTTDGSLFLGHLERRDSQSTVVVTTAGTRVEIPAGKIREVTVARGRMVAGEYWRPDPNKTRLFFAPTGRAVGHMEGYVGTFLVVLPFVAVGIGDHFTMSGGAPVLFGEFSPIYIAPKVTLVEKPEMALAVGALSFIPSPASSLESFGVAFGVGTFGNQDQAVTVGVGYGYAGNDMAGEPTIMLGGEIRVARSLKLISENYAIAGARAQIMTGGLRVLGERLSADVGLIAAGGGGNTACCLPIVNFAYRFGSPARDRVVQEQ